MHFVHLGPPLCPHLLMMQEADATAHPWFKEDTRGH